MRDIDRGQAIALLAHSAVPVLLTGTVAETALATIRVPGGRLGPHGALRISSLWTITNNANNKVPRIKFQAAGGAGAVEYCALGLTTAATLMDQRVISNRGSEASQVGGANSTTIFGSSSAAVITSTINTALDSEILFTGQLADVGDSLTLQRYLVELIGARPAGA